MPDISHYVCRLDSSAQKVFDHYYNLSLAIGIWGEKRRQGIIDGFNELTELRDFKQLIENECFESVSRTSAFAGVCLVTLWYEVTESNDSSVCWLSDYLKEDPQSIDRDLAIEISNSLSQVNVRLILESLLIQWAPGEDSVIDVCTLFIVWTCARRDIIDTTCALKILSCISQDKPFMTVYFANLCLYAPELYSELQRVVDSDFDDELAMFQSSQRGLLNGFRDGAIFFEDGDNYVIPDDSMNY